MDFVILKVNGTDVSSFSHEDAVRAFLTAQEPIVVEVKRRIIADADADTDDDRKDNRFASTACQTDISGCHWIDESPLDCLAPDIDLEEVTLRKCSSDERLGLTVCYSSGSEVDTCTEVYIRDIAPESVADRDGRLRQGDQILQVNGKDVANKEETESLFAENRKAVTLLVSRCYTRSDEYLDNFEAATSLEQPTTSSSESAGAAYQNSLIEQHEVSILPERLSLTNSLVRSKIDSINEEISQLDHRMQSIQLVNKRKPPQLPHIPAPALESDTEHIYETIPEDSSDLEPIYSCPYECGDDNLIEQWLKNHQSDEGFREAPKEAAKKKGRITTSSGEDHENSSSAYNTGGSCNSNPLTFELAAMEDGKNKDVYRSTLVLCEKIDDTKESNNDTTCESCKRQSKTRKSKSSNKITSPSSPTRIRTSGQIQPHILSDTMYTNMANLQQTMLLQQQLFRQALVQQNPDMVLSKPTTSFTSPSLSQYQFSRQEQSAPLETKMEWKVKRRPDGTRYIARRPVRNRILKNREIKISEERAGLTTEDDTISELKVGRYWTKEERKRHLEKSRERKQRQEILVASRSAPEEGCAGDVNKAVSTSRKTANNIDNTARKHKNTKTRAHSKEKESFENFSAVQDVIVHGSKVPNSNSKIMGLLSVTTV